MTQRTSANGYRTGSHTGREGNSKLWRMRLGAGDALDAEISYRQAFDSELGVYVNDPNPFVISRVIRPVPKA
jgi:hypothetical protein